MVSWASRIIGLAFLIVSLPSIAQLRDIDSTKLPQSPAVQAAFRSAQDLEPYSRSWTSKWSYNIPRAQVQDKLADDVGILSHALQSNPTNHELQLLTGLVAHFAYNLNDEAAFDIATSNLTKAASAEPSDIRGEWFLGIHQCQALQVVSGMNRLMALEAKVTNPPADFWDDYITCATVSNMPAHALRAVDRAVAAGQSPERFTQLSAIANSRYKTADLTQLVLGPVAWSAEDTTDERVVFTSHLCGLSFAIPYHWEMQVNDIKAGVCSASFNPPATKSNSAATILVMAERPRESQTLEQFARQSLHSGHTQIASLPPSSCPIEGCLALDVLLPDFYPKQGGGHILLVAFERDESRYDGLALEKPQDPRPAKGPQVPVSFRPAINFRRIPGKLYYLVALDSSEKIFATSKPEFENFLKSLVVE